MLNASFLKYIAVKTKDSLWMDGSAIYDTSTNTETMGKLKWW